MLPDYSVIVAAEVGFDDTHGESWSDWDSDSIYWYARLHPHRKENFNAPDNWDHGGD